MRRWLHVVTDAGRGFGGLDVDGAGVGAQALSSPIQRNGVAVRSGDEIDLAAEGLSERFPALAEFSGGEDEDAIAGRGEVGDGGLHCAGTGGGEEQDSFFVPTKTFSWASTRS